MFTILLVLTRGLWYFWKKGTSEKGLVKIEDWVFSVHFVLGFQENSIYSLHLFSLRYYKMVQSLAFGFKNDMKNLGNIRQAAESPKSWNSMDYFCSKNTLL